MLNNSVLRRLMCLACFMQATLPAVRTIQLSIEPRVGVVRDHGSRIVCQADESLTRCQFKNYVTGDLYDLDLGRQGQLQSVKSSGITFRYAGNGLESGQCGIDLQGLNQSEVSLIGCRVQSKTSNWEYSYMVLHGTASFTEKVYSLQPKQQLANERVRVVFSGTADETLRTCNWKWFSNYKYNGFNMTNLATGKICSLTIPLTVAHMNGVILSEVIPAGSSNVFVDFATLIIRKVHANPTLTVESTDNTFQDGDVLSATCVVTNSRPVTAVTWYLGAYRVDAQFIEYDGGAQSTAWRWSFEEQSVVEKLTLPLTWHHHGMKLRCEAGGIKSTEAVLNVKFLPRISQVTISYKVGKSGSAVIRVLANPRPLFNWKIGSQRLNKNDVEKTSRLVVVENYMIPGQVGLYETTLQIKEDFSLEDFKQDIILNAENQMGLLAFPLYSSQSTINTSLSDYEKLKIVCIVLATLCTALVVAAVTFAICFAGELCCFAGYSETGGVVNYSGINQDSGHIDLAVRQQPFPLPKTCDEVPDNMTGTHDNMDGNLYMAPRQSLPGTYEELPGYEDTQLLPVPQLPLRNDHVSRSQGGNLLSESQQPVSDSEYLYILPENDAESVSVGCAMPPVAVPSVLFGRKAGK